MSMYEITSRAATAGMCGRTPVHEVANKGTGHLRTGPQAAPCFPFLFHSAEVPSVPSGAIPRVGGRQSRASSFPGKGNSEAKTGSHLYLHCATLIFRGSTKRVKTFVAPMGMIRD